MELPDVQAGLFEQQCHRLVDRPLAGFQSLNRCSRHLDVASDEMSQTFSGLYKPPLTIRFPSGLKLTLRTVSGCPLRVSVSWTVHAERGCTEKVHLLR